MTSQPTPTRSFLEAIYANHLPLPVSHDDLTGVFVALYLLGEDHNLVGESCWWIALSEAGIFERELEHERRRTMMNQYPCLAIHRAFAKGWHEGTLGAAYHTAREVQIGSPEYSHLEVEAYLNGADDGRRNDRFRLDSSCSLCRKGLQWNT